MLGDDRSRGIIFTVMMFLTIIAITLMCSINVKAEISYNEFREYSIKYLKEMDVEKTVNTFAYSHDFYKAFCSEASTYYSKYCFLTCDIEEYFKDSISDYFVDGKSFKKERSLTYGYISRNIDIMNPTSLNMIFILNGRSSLMKCVYNEISSEDPDLLLADKLNRANYCVNFLVTNNISNTLVYNSWKTASGCTIYKVLRSQF